MAVLSIKPYYEMGTTTLTKPEHVDSTIKLYDIRVRHALRLIVSDPYFWDNTQKAVRSLLNGKVWHVLMARIGRTGLDDTDARGAGRQGRHGRGTRQGHSTCEGPHELPSLAWSRRKNCIARHRGFPWARYPPNNLPV